METVTATGLRQRKRADSRARVVNVAFGLFEKNGYDEVTVAEVCRVADIAPRTFFRYFPTKDHLLAEPATVMAARLHDALRQQPRSWSDERALAAAVEVLGAQTVAERARTVRHLTVVRSAMAAGAHPLLRLTDQENATAHVLIERSGNDRTVDWRLRMLVARSTAAFRVWLDDLVDGVDGDPCAHLAEILAAR